MFDEVGGFDPKYVAYFEDVDLGWRLWLLGYSVRLAANAKCYHLMHGTSDRFPEHQLVLLRERNALRTIIKNYDDRHLLEVLGPALLLLVHRAIGLGGLSREPYELGAVADDTEVVPRTTLAHFHTVADIVRDLDDLIDIRRDLQARRRRTDAELLDRFGRPQQPLSLDPAYLEAHNAIATKLGLDAQFDHQRATTVVVVGPSNAADTVSRRPGVTVSARAHR